LKNFRIPHPNKPDKDIVYTSLEGPKAAVYIRGTSRLDNGRTIIKLPEHFTAVAAEDTITVQLTPRSASSKGLAVVEQSLKGIKYHPLSGWYDESPQRGLLSES